jgi:hypothetical protein
MKYLFALFIVGIIGLFVLSGCTQSNPIVGGDKDEHGCIPSAGYSWCEEKQKCLRVWEENCTVNPSPVPPVGCSEMIEQEALSIARNSECGDNFKCGCPEGYTQEGDVCNPDCYYETPQCGAPSIQCAAILTCNPNSKTYWVDLTIERAGCAPACVIDTVNKSAEINWRCTGFIPN